MKVAYIAPYYPHVSHSFIRREIAALEGQGISVERFALRPVLDAVDPADIAERAKTTALVALGPGRLFAATLRMLFIRPVAFWRALRRTVRYGRRSDRGVIRHLIYLAEACAFVRMLAQRDATHVHAHFGTNAATVAAFARALGGPPYSFTVHGPEEFDRPDALSLGNKIASSAFVVAISSFGRSQLYRWCEAAHWPKVHVVHCGLDAHFLGVESTPVPAETRIVCVGRLTEQKGQLLLIEAVARLAAAGVPCELVLAGDGPMRREVEAAVARHKLTDRVRITGWVTGAQVRQEILAARAMVLPSFAEGLPVVLMEAMALGRPVVTTFVAGIPELVKNGEHGWVVPAGDIEALTIALREVVESPLARLDAMGRAGAAQVAWRHDIRTEAAKLAGLFATVPTAR